jgi:hypothetical protein
VLFAVRLHLCHRLLTRRTPRSPEIDDSNLSSTSRESLHFRGSGAGARGGVITRDFFIFLSCHNVNNSIKRSYIMKRRSSFQRSRVPDKLARVVVGLLFVCFGVADIAFADGTGSLEKLHRSAAERSEPYHGFRIHRRMRDGNNHAIFAVRQWPRRTFPGISQRSRGRDSRSTRSQ